VAPGQFHLPGQHRWRCRPTRWCLVFCSHRDYFVVTRTFTAVYLDLLHSRSFTVTISSLPPTGTGKKRGTATQTAPNKTAGPLGGIARKPQDCLYIREFMVTQNFHPSTGTWSPSKLIWQANIIHLSGLKTNAT
jgi:hypothetical protein